jgi:hypothetical protein
MKHIKAVSLLQYSLAFLVLAVAVLGTNTVQAAVKNPQSGSTGLEGTVSSPAPTKGATITTPVNGQTFTSVPITVNGLCPSGLLVKVFANNVFVGSAQCTNGSYSIQINLFSGQNDIVVRVYDALDQPGPDSNPITVTFNDAQTVSFGSRVTLSSGYAQRGANPGEVLTWPIILSGGIGPYAISVDWGDNSAQSLQSEPFAGNITISHTYKTAGVYKVIVKATDHNGTTAFLQLVGISNGQVTQSTASTSPPSSGTTIVKTKPLIWPLLLIFLLIFISFWLGRRFELAALRRQLDISRSQDKDEPNQTS